MAPAMLSLASLASLAVLSSAAAPPARQAKLAVTNASQVPSDFGDLTCMRWTGGSCLLFGCKSNRGPTVCDQGHCMCQEGNCANAQGECDAYHGEWLGSYALGFTNAYDKEASYVQAQRANFYVDGMSQNTQNSISHTLVATSDPGKYWKIALTGHGHVRFESNLEPGHVMSIYNNRRRRTDENSNSRRRMFLQLPGRGVLSPHPDAHIEDPHESEAIEARSRFAAHPSQALSAVTSFMANGNSSDRVKISDNDDLWPILMPFKYVHPLDASFRVRQTMQDGGGLEIWDPQHQVALSSADRDWFFSDIVAKRGVAECQAPGLFFGGDCQGRQHVLFEPQLPMKAVVIGPRDEILEIGSIGFFEALLMLCCMCACGFTCGGGYSYLQ